MILIALGANLPSFAGIPAQTLTTALGVLRKHGIAASAVSPYYVTPAWPDPSDPSFVNAVARVETALAPHALMALLHKTETAFGRIRSAPNAPRTLDLDLLDYEGRVAAAGSPTLPHPRIAERPFVLVPLADVAPGWTHPVTGRSVRDLIAALPPHDIKRLAP